MINLKHFLTNIMRTYIKLYGPPVVKAIKALEKIAVDMPEVCIMDTIIRPITEIPPRISLNITMGSDEPVMDSIDQIMTNIGVGDIPEERCNTLISKYGERLGEYDFFFEWFEVPTNAQVQDLLEKIDEALEPLGVRYTVVTKPE